MPNLIEQRIIAETGLRASWPASVRTHADRIAASPTPSGEREDLRSMPLVTIDGASARDFDDAVFAEPQGDGWRVIVAIADVSHYVRAGDPLDREAAQRGVSVYFPGSVLPMLPEALSNDLCSLKPGRGPPVPRLRDASGRPGARQDLEILPGCHAFGGPAYLLGGPRGNRSP